MTHDELFRKINWWKGAYVNRNNCQRCIKYLNTLRAVVELHKPIEDEWFNTDEMICEECTREEYTISFPCPTIQAIEKELA